MPSDEFEKYLNNLPESDKQQLEELRKEGVMKEAQQPHSATPVVTDPEKGNPEPADLGKETKERIDSVQKSKGNNYLNEAEKEPEPTETEYCLLYTSPSPRDLSTSRMPSSA